MQATTVSSTRYVAQLVVTWVLMVPLLFFATGGIIRFDAYTRNNSLEASYTQLVSSPSQNRVPIRGMVFCICILLLCTNLRQVARIARDNKIWAVPDNHAMKVLTHCFNWVSCCFGLGVLKRHSHSLRKRGKWSLGMPLKRRRWRLA